MTALREKRDNIAAQVGETEKRLAKLRAALANLDAAMNILNPTHPDHIPGRGACQRRLYFGRNELPRLIRDALREASKPLSASEIAASCIAAKGLPPSAHAATVGSVATVLNLMARRKEVTRAGKARGVRWAICQAE